MDVTLLGDRMIEGVGPDELLPGEIALRQKRTGETVSGHKYERQFVSVGDITTPEGRKLMNDHLNILDDMAADHPEWPVPEAGISNPASDIFYENHLTGTTMQFWRDGHMPNAEALYPLQRIDDMGRLFPNGIVDAHAQDIFLHAIDSIAIRARGIIHNDILLKKASEMPGGRLHALALGAGAGVPNIDATVKVRDEYGTVITWQEYDLRYQSLATSLELFNEAGIPGDNVETFRADYAKAFKREDNSVDIVDMLGLWEYLKAERCVKAVSEAYRVLKPGGVFVVSNMLPDRPQLNVHQKVIGWKGVKLRSIDELIDIAVEAKIESEEITIKTSDDNVYAVMEIHKR